MFRKDLLIYSIRDGTDGLTIKKKKKIQQFLLGGLITCKNVLRYKASQM
jgi:hypothetical protein